MATDWEFVNAATTELGVLLKDDPSSLAVKYYLWREQNPMPRFTETGPDPDDLKRILVDVAGSAGTPEEQAAVIGIIRRAFADAAAV